MDLNKITLIVSSLAGGGAEGVCVTVANGLADRGWSVDLVVLHLNNAVYDKRVSEKVNLIILGVNKARYSYRPISRYLKVRRPSKVLVFNTELTIILVVSKLISRMKFIIVARNINTMSKKRQLIRGFWRKFFLQPAFDFLYCNSDYVVNQCKGMENDLLKIYPKLKGKTGFIYNPVNDVVEEAASNVDFSRTHRREYLLCVGRLEDQKAFHCAIQGFAGVQNSWPSLRLKIVGQGSLESELKKCAIQHGVQDKVDFEGFQDDIVPYYLNAKATVLTSLYEGFPNVLIESITLGTPVVAFDCPNGPSEIIQNGVNGYLVEYQSKSALIESLTKVLNLEIDPKRVAGTSVDYSCGLVIKSYEEMLWRFL